MKYSLKINYFFFKKTKIIIIEKIIFISIFTFLLYINLVKNFTNTQKTSEVSQSNSNYFKMKNNSSYSSAFILYLFKVY